MTRKQSLGSGAGALVVALLLAWQLGWFSSEDKFVAELKTLAAAPPSDDTRNAMRDLMRSRFEGTTPEQRQAMFEQMAPVFMPMIFQRFESEYDRFMAMSPQERNKELDRRIDEMEKRNPGGRGAPFGGNASPAQVDSFRKKMLDWTTPDQRAKFEDGMRMMNDRRKQRGLQPMMGP